MDALGEEGLAAAHLPPEEDGLPGLGEGAGQLDQPGHLPAGVAHVLEAAVGQIALEAVPLPQGPLALPLHLLHLIEGEDHPLHRVQIRHRRGVGHHVHPRHVEHRGVELPPLGQGVQPQLGVLPGHEGGQGLALQLVPFQLQDLAGHVVAPHHHPVGIQLQDPVEGVVQQGLEVGGVAPLGVGDEPHAAGVEQAGAQGVLGALEEQGALAQPAAVGVDEVAPQNHVHPVGDSLLGPPLHLLVALHEVGAQLDVQDVLKPLDAAHHVGDGHHADAGPGPLGGQAAGPVEEPGDLQAGELDLHQGEVGVGPQDGGLPPPGHQNVRPQPPGLGGHLQHLLGAGGLVEHHVHPQLPGDAPGGLHHLHPGEEQSEFCHKVPPSGRRAARVVKKAAPPGKSRAAPPSKLCR